MKETNNAAPDVGPVPLETLELWLDAVAKMDADVLESFMRRIRRTWAASELGLLEEAAAARYRALPRPGQARLGAR